MSNGFVAEIDNDAAEALAEAKSGGKGGFPPLPAGKYQATVLKIDGVDVFGGQGGNAKKKVLKLQLKIVGNSPTGRNRTFFVRVPLFTRYAPNAKNPKGATARGFWDFFGKAIGWSDDLLISNQLPGPSDVQGKQLTITLSAPIAPDQYNLLGSNEVDFYDAAGNVDSTPVGPVNVPWLDANGDLIGGAPAPTQAPAQAQAPAQGQAPPAYTPPAASDEAPPAYTPDAEDVAFAEAVAGGKAF